MKFFAKTILTAALMGASTFAMADFTPADLARNVTHCDVNKDGKITRVEWMSMVKERVEKMANKEGMVDSKKAMAFLLQLQDGTYNQTGPMVSAKDFAKKLGDMFDKADKNKKGMLDSKQFEIFLQEVVRSAG
jgi:Ca2+-binding EF-hand superfamily protein